LKAAKLRNKLGQPNKKKNGYSPFCIKIVNVCSRQFLLIRKENYGLLMVVWPPGALALEHPTMFSAYVAKV